MAGASPDRQPRATPPQFPWPGIHKPTVVPGIPDAANPSSSALSSARRVRESSVDEVAASSRALAAGDATSRTANINEATAIGGMDAADASNHRDCKLQALRGCRRAELPHNSDGALLWRGPGHRETPQRLGVGAAPPPAQKGNEWETHHPMMRAKHASGAPRLPSFTSRASP